MAERRQEERRDADRAGPGRRGSERRTEERKKQRTTCEILDGDRVQRGVVRDVSPSGLFVQTSLPIDLGTEVEVHITSPSNSETSPIIFVRATVVRKLMVDRRLSSIASGGLGLRIIAAPPSYYEALEVPPPSDAQIEIPLTRRPEKDEATASPQEPAGSRPEASQPVASEPDANFRIRVGRGPRSYWMALAADSESDAMSQAEARAGEGWEILEIALHEADGATTG